EFKFSIQSVIGAGTCIDALYDVLIPLVKIDEGTRLAWKRNRTARHIVVFEVLRTAFVMKNSLLDSFRETIRVVYKLRGLAAHPTSSEFPMMVHPDLNLLMDWRLANFRGDLAESIV